MPIGSIEFCFRSVDDGFLERNREADGCVIDLVVVRIVVYISPEIVGSQLHVLEEGLGQARFKVVSYGRLDG